VPRLARASGNGALGHEDPALVEGSDIEKGRAFVQAATYLKDRISVFLNLPFASLDQMSLTNRLRDIGRREGTTANSPAAQRR
jgi:arsenate reductase (thioredoxin)